MHPGLKKIVLRKLNQDLSKVEIILSENQSIWFIDRANKYWYFELEKSGKLWWRYEFFTNFFPLFCLEIDEFQPLLSEWVEGILNCGVSATGADIGPLRDQVEGILNRGVSATFGNRLPLQPRVEGILNRGVSATGMENVVFQPAVEGVLNSGVSATGDLGMERITTVEGILNYGYRKGSRKVDEVLNHKVVTTEYCGIIPNYDLEEVLNHKVVSTLQSPDIDPSFVEAVLNREINKIDGGELLDNSTLEKVLNHKVVSISHANEQNELIQQILVHELIYEVESASPLDTPAHDSVDEVLEYKVTRTIPDLNDSMIDVERLLDSKQ